MRRTALILSLLSLGACAAPSETHDCNCVETPSDDSSIAMSGFTEAAIISEGMDTDAKGNTVYYYQYDPAIATPEMIAASPGNSCGYYGRTVLSTRFADTYAGDIVGKKPGSKFLIITCSATVTEPNSG